MERANEHHLPWSVAALADCSHLRRWLHAARSHEADSNAAPDSDDDGKPADFSAGAAPTGRALLRRCIDAGSGAAPGSHSGKLMEHGATAPVTLRSYLRRCNEASHGAAPDSTGGEPALHGAAASEQPVSAGAEDLHSCVVKDGYVPGVEAGGQRPDGSGGGEAPRREVAAAGMQGAAEAVQRVLQECSVVAAMHPDQACTLALFCPTLDREQASWSELVGCSLTCCIVDVQPLWEDYLLGCARFRVCFLQEMLKGRYLNTAIKGLCKDQFENCKGLAYSFAWAILPTGT